MKKKIDKRCCGKALNKGDTAYNRYGILMCADCDTKNPASFMAAYAFGTLSKDGHYCGEMVI